MALSETILIKGPGPLPPLQHMPDRVAKGAHELRDSQLSIICLQPRSLVRFAQMLLIGIEGVGVKRLQKPCELRRHYDKPHALL